MLVPNAAAYNSAGLAEGANVASRSRAGLCISGKRTAKPIAPPPRPSDHGFLFWPIRLAFPFSHATLPFSHPRQSLPHLLRSLPPRNFPYRLKVLAPQLLRHGPHSLLAFSFQTSDRLQCRQVIGCCLIGEPFDLLIYLIP